MASMSRKGSPRYLAFKFWNAVQECLQPQTVAKQTGLGSGAASEGASTQPQTLSSFIEAFKKAFHAPVTSVMYITGPAMAPVRPLTHRRGLGARRADDEGAGGRDALSLTQVRTCACRVCPRRFSTRQRSQTGTHTRSS